MKVEVNYLDLQALRDRISVINQMTENLDLNDTNLSQLLAEITVKVNQLFPKDYN